MQAIIINGALWSSFQGRFTSKEALDQKFSQLAELRNGIRHTRTINEVARKEGEAAIIWFEEVLRTFEMTFMKSLIKDGRVVTAVDDYKADILIEEGTV